MIRRIALAAALFAGVIAVVWIVSKPTPSDRSGQETAASPAIPSRDTSEESVSNAASTQSNTLSSQPNAPSTQSNASAAIPPSSGAAAPTPSGGTGQPGPAVAPTPFVPPSTEELSIAQMRIEKSTLLNEQVAGVGAEAIERVRFLKLRMNGQNLDLISANSVNGRPKRARQTFPLEQLAPGVLVRALNSDGATVWQDVIQDPTVLRCCFEHPTEDRLTGFTTTDEEAVFDVRIPDLPAITEVELFRHPSPANSLENVAIDANLLGRFEIGQ